MQLNTSMSGTVNAVAGLHYRIEVAVVSGTGYGTECCAAVKWGTGDLGSLACDDQPDVCDPGGGGALGMTWSTWKTVPSTPGDYTVTVAVYEDGACGGTPSAVLTKTLHVYKGASTTSLEISDTSIVEGDEVELTATVTSLVGDPWLTDGAKWDYAVAGYASATQVQGTVAFYADGALLGTETVYGGSGDWGRGTVSLTTTLPFGSPEITAEFASSTACHEDSASAGILVTVSDVTPPTDPTPSSTSHAVSVWSNDDTVDIAVSGANDTGSGVDGFEVAWNQSATWVPARTKHHEESWSGDTFAATSDGDWYVHIATVDSVGNWSGGTSLGPFRIDTTAPSVPAGLSPVGGTYTNDDPPTLSWEASTDVGGSGLRPTDTYRYVVDGGSSGYTGNLEYHPFLAEGAYTWKVRARDVAGNNSAYASDRVLYIDRTKPTDPTPSSTSHSVGVVSNDATVDIEISGALDPLSGGLRSGVDGFDIAWDKSPTWTATRVKDEEETWTGGTFTATSDGDWYFHVATVDVAGNWTSTEDLGPFQIDVTPPDVVSVSPSDSLIVDGDIPGTFSVTVVFNEEMTTDGSADPALVFVPAVDDGPSPTLVNESGSWNGTTDTYTLTYDLADANLNAKSVTIDVKEAKDAAGNDQRDHDPVHEFTIDTLNPTVTRAELSDNVISDENVGGTFAVTIDYSESMLGGTAPTIVFSPNLDTTLALRGTPSSRWETATQYVASYAVLDGDVTILDDDVAISGAQDAVGNVQVPYSHDDRLDVDTENPAIESFVVTGGAADGDCRRGVEFSATVVDPNGVMIPSGITVTDATTTNATIGAPYEVATSPVDGDPTRATIEGKVDVAGLSDCPAVVTITLDAVDSVGNAATQQSQSDDVIDVESPVIDALMFNTDETYSVEATGYDLDGHCAVTVYFSAAVTDNCCISSENVEVTVTVPTENATLGAIEVDCVQNGQDHVDVAGSAVVQCLTDCPARVEVRVAASDCCGQNAVRETTAAEGLVWDHIAPEPSHDPLQTTYDANRPDELDVRLDEFGVYRLIVRENTPERIDVIANDADNCGHGTCCGTMWIDAITDAPDRGTATVEVDHGDCRGGSVIRYAPDRGYLGPDSFDYTVRDACGNVSDVVTVHLQVVEQTAMEDVSLVVCSGESLFFDISAADLWVDRDPDVIPFEFEIVAGPDHGVVIGDLSQLRRTRPSTATDPNTGERVPTLDFTEAVAVGLTYTPAVGFIGRDAFFIRFSDPFGAFAIAKVDIRVIECAGLARGPAAVAVGREAIVPIIVPESSAILQATDATILMSQLTGVVHPEALSFVWDDKVDRHLLLLDTETLPPGAYRLTIRLGGEELVDLVIEVGESE